MPIGTLEQVVDRIVTAMAVLLAVTLSDSALAQQHKTYRCKVADVVSLAEDGRLRPDDNPRTIFRQLYDGVLIDTLTGAVTYASDNGGRRRSVWDVVQQGDDGNDYVLVQRLLTTPRSSDFIRTVAATDSIRIRAWKENPMVRFMAFGLSTIASGSCEVVR